MSKKIFLLIFCLCILCIPFEVNATSTSAEEQINALMETANAYYRQGVQVQYDSYRKNLYATPEDATSQNYVYTVCSGFAFQTYYQTLGIKIPITTDELLDYAQNNQNKTSVVLFSYNSKEEIYSKEVMGTKELPNYSEFAKKIIQIAQPGDIFVVSRTCYVNRIGR